MTVIDINDEIPDFLSSYGLLIDHFDLMLSDDDGSKGDIFVNFATKIIPLSEIGSQFEQPRVNEKKSHDKGVDIIAYNNDRTKILYAQAKYKVKDAPAFDNILSKFNDFYQKSINTSLKENPIIPGLIIPGTVYPTEVHFLVFTIKDIKTTIIPNYEKSNYGSKSFYNQLKADNRIHVLEGNSILPILQSAYRKSHILPSNIELRLERTPLRSDNVYIGIVSATEIEACYRKFGDALFLDNIREFLGPTSGKVKTDNREYVNKAIVETIENEPDKLLARNNGITFRAEVVIPSSDGYTLQLQNASIVNGCQTTICLKDNPKREACVLVKIVETHDSWDIAKAANFQNEVKQIELDLARYIRPQKVKRAASKIGIGIEASNSVSIFNVMDTIYKIRADYDEIYYLFVGLFSNLPTNAIAANYTELNSELLKDYLNSDPNGEETFERLFMINKTATQAMDEEIAGYSDESLENELEEIFWKSGKPNYRALVTITAACAATDMNIYKPRRKNYVEMSDFLSRVSSLIQTNIQEFSLYYSESLEKIVSAIGNSEESYRESKQRRNQRIKALVFERLLNDVRKAVAKNKRRYKNLGE